MLKLLNSLHVNAYLFYFVYQKTETQCFSNLPRVSGVKPGLEHRSGVGLGLGSYP